MKLLEKSIRRGLVSIAIVLCCSVLLFGQEEHKGHQINLVGALLSQDQLIKNERILLYLNDEVVDSIYSDDIGLFQFALEYDKTYFLVIGTQKHQLKWIEVGTKIPLEHRKENHTAHLYLNIAPKPENPEYVIIETIAIF